MTLDVASGGVLGSLITALIMWLNSRNKAARMPPLGEDVARTYATKEELTRCQGFCRKDIDGLRELIDGNDEKAESRARGTHARIDKIYLEQQKNNKALGMLIGVMVVKGLAPVSIATTLTSED